MSVHQACVLVHEHPFLKLYGLRFGAIILVQIYQNLRSVTSYTYYYKWPQSDPSVGLLAGFRLPSIYKAGIWPYLGTGGNHCCVINCIYCVGVQLMVIVHIYQFVFNATFENSQERLVPISQSETAFCLLSTANVFILYVQVWVTSKQTLLL